MTRKKAKLSKVASGRSTVNEANNLMCQVMETLGYDVADENFINTPMRFVKYLQEFHRPFDPAKILKVDFSNVRTEEGYKGMLAQSNIPFRSICPHHLLPVTGVAHIGYIPGARLVGLSKFVRLVEAVGHELPRMQETITDILADILMRYLGAKGVMVVINAEHGCMKGRGVKVHDTPTATSTLRGLFRDVPAAKDEFQWLVSQSHRR
jgi:GTP cyclohydrolase I